MGKLDGSQQLSFYSVLVEKQQYSENIFNSFSVSAQIVERIVETCKDFRESLFSINSSEVQGTILFIKFGALQKLCYVSVFHLANYFENIRLFSLTFG